MKEKCLICGTSTIDRVRLGELCSTGGLQAHLFCLLLSNDCKQDGHDHEGINGFLKLNIIHEAALCMKKICCFCSTPGASCHCNYKGCPKKFHLPCGHDHKILAQFHPELKTYCDIHRPISNIPKALLSKLSELQCVICYDSVGFTEQDLIWAECCQGEVILHRECVQKYAASSGYFTKCPCCNNKETFVECVQTWGVFVPECDASWEMETNAYADLYATPQHCLHDKCMCPKGRSYVSLSETGPWRILLCDLCGSAPAHKGCVKVSVHICSDCSTVTSRVNVFVPAGSAVVNTQPCPDQAATNDDTIIEINSSDTIQTSRFLGFPCGNCIFEQSTIKMSDEAASPKSSARKITEKAEKVEKAEPKKRSNKNTKLAADASDDEGSAPVKRRCGGAKSTTKAKPVASHRGKKKEESADEDAVDDE